jgi:hypothetical protein
VPLTVAGPAAWRVSLRLGQLTPCCTAGQACPGATVLQEVKGAARWAACMVAALGAGVERFHWGRRGRATARRGTATTEKGQRGSKRRLLQARRIQPQAVE